MAELLRMPEVAASAVEAILSEWGVEENAAFGPDDVIATVETEKAMVEIEAEKDGVLVRKLVSAGTKVAVGAPIALVGAPDESLADVDAILAELGAEPMVASGAPAASPTHEPEGAPEPDVVAKPTPGAEPVRNEDRIFVSPVARKIARESGLDYTTLEGSGPRGRIRKSDVEAALLSRGEGKTSQASAPSELSAAAPKSAPRPPSEKSRRNGEPSYSVVEHSRLRQAVAARLTESKQQIPHFYVRGTARVDGLVALRTQVNAASEVKVSFNDLILKAAGLAHRQHPDMNVVWTDEGVRRYEQVDIAVAIASSRGLVTPVLRDVDNRSLTDIARAVRDLAERADVGRLRQDELEGGTSSVSNLGMYGTEEFTAIINPPHASILSVGAIREEPVVKDGVVEVGQVLHVVLSADHRPVDGSVAAAWMRTFVSILESPLRIVI